MNISNSFPESGLFFGDFLGFPSSLDTKKSQGQKPTVLGSPGACWSRAGGESHNAWCWKLRPRPSNRKAGWDGQPRCSRLEAQPKHFGNPLLWSKPQSFSGILWYVRYMRFVSVAWMTWFKKRQVLGVNFLVPWPLCQMLWSLPRSAGSTSHHQKDWKGTCHQEVLLQVRSAVLGVCLWHGRHPQKMNPSKSGEKSSELGVMMRYVLISMYIYNCTIYIIGSHFITAQHLIAASIDPRNQMGQGCWRREGFTGSRARHGVCGFAGLRLGSKPIRVSGLGKYEFVSKSYTQNYTDLSFW